MTESRPESESLTFSNLPAPIRSQPGKLKEQEKRTAANKALIDANTARFVQLDDYYIYDEVTILSANGKTAVDSKYVSPLSILAEKASTVEGYMIPVKGYASASAQRPFLRSSFSRDGCL